MRNTIRNIAAIAIIVSCASLFDAHEARAIEEEDGGDSAARRGCWWYPTDPSQGTCPICRDECDPLIRQKCCLVFAM